MTELTFIRHGQTDWNLQHRFQGQIDVPLNATGHRQAASLAARLAASPADRLYTSDLQRAQQTAAPLGAAWGLQPIALTAFREQNFGVLEGLVVDTIKTAHPDLWAAWLAHQADYALPDGESLRQFSLRVLAGVSALVADHPGRKLTIVTHGGVLDVLWRHANGLPLDGLRDCLIPNTGINRLHWRDETLVIETWGDDGHLAGDSDISGFSP